MLKRVSVVSFLLVAVVAMVFSGGRPERSDEPVLRAMLVGGLEHQAVWEALIPEFEEQTGIRVEWQALPRDQLIVRATTLGQARSGEYDVYGTHFSTIPQLYPYLADLYELYPEEFFDDFVPSSLEGATLDGRLYQMPRYFDTRMLFYRTDLFEEAGLSPPSTWNELVSVSQELTDSSAGRWGLVQPGQGNALMRHFSDFLWQAGGDFFDDDWNPIFNQAEGSEALNFIMELVYRHNVVAPSSVSFGWGEQRTMFAQGAAAMIYEWPSGPAVYDNPEQSNIAGRYAFAPIPGHRTSISTAVAHGFGMNRHSTRQALAAKFIEVMTSPEFQRREYEVRGTLPSRLSAADAVINSAEGAERERLEAQREIMLSGRSWPAIPEMAQIERAIYEELERAITRQKPVQRALDDAATASRRILQEAGYY